MIGRLAISMLVLTSAWAAQTGTEPKASASEYPVHAEAGNIQIGAEFTVHSFYGRKQTFIAQDYLVVEVALFPPKGEHLIVSPRQFTMKVNGKKEVLSAQPPQFVAASVGANNWDLPPGVTDNPEGAPNATQIALETAFPDEEVRGPVSGFLYFAQKGKIKNINSLELIYEIPAGSATLKLR